MGNVNGIGPAIEPHVGGPVTPSQDLAAYDKAPAWFRRLLRDAPYDLHTPEMLTNMRALSKKYPAQDVRRLFAEACAVHPNFVRDAYGPDHPQARE